MENIALWKMYTNYLGVRLCLDDDLFVGYPTNHGISYFSESIHVEGNGLFADANNIIALHDIDYTQNLKSKIQEIIHEDEGNIYVDVENIGRNKSKEWSFQNECRFKLFGVPYLPTPGTKENLVNKYVEALFYLYEEKYQKALMPSEVFVNIKPEVLDNIEVMLGPNTSEADKIIVEALLKDFPKAHIGVSKFQDKIRK